MVPTPDLPQKMIELRAYARWEEGGRRVLPPEEQRREFYLAAEELWAELEAGCSIAQLQEWFDKGTPPGDRPSSWLQKDPAIVYVRPGRQNNEGLAKEASTSTAQAETPGEVFDTMKPQAEAANGASALAADEPGAHKAIPFSPAEAKGATSPPSPSKPSKMLIDVETVAGRELTDMMVALQVAGIEVTPPIDEQVEAELKAAAAQAASLVATAEKELLHASSLLSKAMAIMQEGAKK